MPNSDMYKPEKKKNKIIFVHISLFIYCVAVVYQKYVNCQFVSKKEKSIRTVFILSKNGAKNFAKKSSISLDEKNPRQGDGKHSNGIHSKPPTHSIAFVGPAPSPSLSANKSIISTSLFSLLVFILSV
jgi:hypothetical protein